MNMARRHAIAGFASVLLLSACGLTSGTRIVTTSGEAKHAYRKIAVIAMSASRDERRTFDDALVSKLSAAGVEGIVGDRYIEDAATANGISPMDAIRAAGADGVIYVWLRADTSTGGVEPTPGSWGWTGAAASWYPAPKVAQAMMAKFEARLYDVGTQQLAWSGVTTTFYPKSVAIDAPLAGEAIVGELVKRGFIVRSR